LQAQPLSRSALPWPLQDQEPRGGTDHRLAWLGHRLSRTLDDEGRFPTRTHREILANRGDSALPGALDHRECGRTQTADLPHF
jgi:hypothetical protein